MTITATSAAPSAAAAPTAPRKEPLERKAVKVLSIDSAESARALPAEYNSNAGEPLLARSATVLGANGQARSIDIIGTAKQWSFFNGHTCEASFVESTRTPGTFSWHFSPVSGGEKITNRDAF